MDIYLTPQAWAGQDSVVFVESVTKSTGRVLKERR